MSRWVLVTGGALRLGRETCLAFARAGWNVACHYNRSTAAARSLGEELTVLGVKWALVPGPLDSADDADKLFRSALHCVGGELHGIVNNASLFEPDTAENFSERGLLAQLQTNLIVPLTLGRMLYRHCVDSQPIAPSALVHILDQKVFNLNPDYFSYTLSKLALERAVAQQAQALAPLVRVNAVAPGLLYISGPQSQENYDLASRANLLRRPIDVARVAQATVFLADNPCITGASLCVDNGQHLVPVPRDIMFVVDELLRNISNEGR
ncbi:MAG: SDR family oxidoreductase [Ramlibacter sp.]|nr:SDR family oxidoreductase [Ramlibacter sp.]